MEKIIIVGVETPQNWKTFQESMIELKSLAISAHGEIVTEVVQKREKINQLFLIGKGKVAELKELSEAHQVELIIFNHELTPRQSQLLSEEIGLPVIDRVQLILDIFAVRAKSREGKLQVELAQLNYLLPRLVGQGKSLSRLGGGIGTRGPGETKLETDRRHIQQRILKIKRNLKEVEKQRQQSRASRAAKDIFQIGLVGYTNAGKSTLLNLLTKAETFAEDQLFATLDPLTRKWRLPQGMIVTLTDTVGFLQELPTQLIEAFRSTLEESKAADLLLHVVDASSPYRHIQEETVLNLLKELGMAHIPRLTVYSKADLLREDKFVPTLFPNCLISAKGEKGRDKLTQEIVVTMKKSMIPYQLDISASQVSKMEHIKRETLLEQQTFDDTHEVYQLRGYAKENSRWQPEIKD